MPDTTSFVIASTGPDKPGILAAICKSLEAVNGSLGNSRMHRLAGMFNGIVVVTVPAGVGQEQLSTALDSARQTGIRISVSPMNGSDSSVQLPNTTTWLISSAGADRPGILRGLAALMQDCGCDFADVSTQLEYDDNQATFVLVCEVNAPAEMSHHVLQAKVDALGAELGTEFLVLDTDMEEPLL